MYAPGSAEEMISATHSCMRQGYQENELALQLTNLYMAFVKILQSSFDDRIKICPFYKKGNNFYSWNTYTLSMF